MTVMSRLRRARNTPPAPFVVGTARSGTTLLRLQLDAHPQLAIPPETYFGSVVRRISRRAGPDELLGALVRLPAWRDLGVEARELSGAFARVQPWSVGEGLRSYYRIYADRHGKPRWGDKTPSNLHHMRPLARVLPEARFIHIIRDPRDVAVSLRGLPFAPGDRGIQAIAATWQENLDVAHSQARQLRHYMEIRYEQLVVTPEEILREVCGFADLDFHPAMLRAHERAGQRLEELRPVTSADGTVRTEEERRSRHTWTLRPPDPTRAGRWRTDLSAEEVRQVEKAAGKGMRKLGYEFASG